MEVAKGAPIEAPGSADKAEAGKPPKMEKAQIESCEAARVNGETAMVKRVIGYYGDALSETANTKLLTITAGV